MTTIAGITTTTTSEVTNYRALGTFIAAQDNDVQAEFLAGLALGMQAPSEFNGLMQMEYITTAVGAFLETEDADAVRWFISELNARINRDEVTG